MTLTLQVAACFFVAVVFTLHAFASQLSCESGIQLIQTIESIVSDVSSGLQHDSVTLDAVVDAVNSNRRSLELKVRIVSSQGHFTIINSVYMFTICL